MRGNHEFYYLDFGTPRAAPGADDPQRWGQLHWLVEHILPEQGAYLAMLPDERMLYLPGTQPVCVAHGIPGQNRVGFHNETPEAQVAAALSGIEAMIETLPLERAAEAYAKMLSGNARFRMVLTMT